MGDDVMVTLHVGWLLLGALSLCALSFQWGYVTSDKLYTRIVRAKTDHRTFCAIVGIPHSANCEVCDGTTRAKTEET